MSESLDFTSGKSGRIEPMPERLLVLVQRRHDSGGFIDSALAYATRNVGDAIRIRDLSSQARPESLSAILAVEHAEYVILVDAAHCVAPQFFTRLLASVSRNSGSLFSPMRVTGSVPAPNHGSLKHRVSGIGMVCSPFGLCFDRDKLLEVIDQMAESDLSTLGINYRTFWGVQREVPVDAQYGFMGRLTDAWETAPQPTTKQLFVLRGRPSDATRRDMLRYTLNLLKRSRSGFKGEIRLAHIRDYCAAFGLLDLTDEFCDDSSYVDLDCALLRWICEAGTEEVEYDRRGGYLTSLVFRSRPPNMPDREFLRADFPDGSVWGYLKYTLVDAKEAKRDPSVVDFYETPVSTSSVILVFDRYESADDNGEAFYAWMQSVHPEYCNVYFALSRSSPDWSRLVRRRFKLVPMFTDEFTNTYLHADAVLSSQFYDIRRGGKSARNSRFVFLQHGLAFNDIRQWMASKHFDRIVTTGTHEVESLANVASHEILNCGMPRLAALKTLPVSTQSARDLLLIAPTWSAGAFGNGGFGAKGAPLLEDFIEMLRDGRFRDWLSRNKLTAVLKPHPNLRDALGSLLETNLVQVFEGTYREAFARTRLLVTDYSSVAFDAAYAGAAVAYLQTDREQFYRHQHYRPSRERQEAVLGPVFGSVQELVRWAIDDRLTDDPSVYRSRAETILDGVDVEKSSDRIFRELLAI